MAAGGDEFQVALFEAAAVTTVVAGLEKAVFAMLPLRLLPGAPPASGMTMVRKDVRVGSTPA